MSEIKLLHCPLCNGEVAIALNGDEVEQWYSITRGFGENKCTCRLFLESEKFYADASLETKERIKNDLVNKWNTRKPMERIVERIKERMGSVKYWAKPFENYDYYDNGFYEGMNEVVDIVKEEGGIDG